MAVTKKVFKICGKYFNDSNLKIAELGSQYVMGDEWGDYGPPYFKEIFKNLDITSYDYSIDNNSIFLDLTKSIPIEINGIYDIVTNFGTSEHVQNQYMCWKNTFEMMKEGGIVISEIPKKGSWSNHCKYYFDENTFLAMYRDFEIIEMLDIHYDVQGYLIYTVMKKRHNGCFLTTEDELMSNVEVIYGFNDRIGY